MVWAGMKLASLNFNYGVDEMNFLSCELLWDLMVIAIVSEGNLVNGKSIELWCWKTPENPLDCKINQSILKEISPEYLLERLMLKLKLQYFGHLMWRSDWLEKTLMLGKIECRRRRGRQRMRWLDGITDLMDMSLSKLRELVIEREAWYAVVHRVTRNPTRLSDWTQLTMFYRDNLKKNWVIFCSYIIYVFRMCCKQPIF